MPKIRLSRIVISIALAGGLWLAAFPAASAFALSLPAGAGSTVSLNAASSSTMSAASNNRIFVKDRHVTIEHRGDLTLIHVTEIIVIVHNGKVTQRHVSFTDVIHRE